MGWSFRKSVRLLPGIRLNLSKSGPRLSIGIPGARASININGRTRIYAEKGPLRYQKAVTLGAPAKKAASSNSGLFAIVRRIFGGP